MAFENSIGQGLALGTLAHPDNSKPITAAIMNKQKLDLMGASRKAKEDALAKRLQEEMDKRVTISPTGVAPIYQPIQAKIISDWATKT